MLNFSSVIVRGNWTCRYDGAQIEHPPYIPRYNITVLLTHFFPPLRFRNQVPTFAVRETASLGQHMLELGCENATVGIN